MWYNACYMTTHNELVILSVPSLCLPSPSSLFFLLADPLELFIPDSLVPFPESELLVFLVPIESFEENRGSLTPWVEDTEGHGATVRDGRKTRQFRALRMSWVVFRIISSTEMLSAPNSADFLASSNWVSKCFVLCWRRLLSLSETSNCEINKTMARIN